MQKDGFEDVEILEKKKGLKFVAANGADWQLGRKILEFTPAGSSSSLGFRGRA